MVFSLDRWSQGSLTWAPRHWQRECGLPAGVIEAGMAGRQSGKHEWICRFLAVATSNASMP